MRLCGARQVGLGKRLEGRSSFNHKIIEAIHNLGGLRFCRSNDMGVDIRRGARLGVSQLVRYDNQRGAVRDHQAGVGVPQGMDGYLWQPGALDELAKPLCDATGKKRRAGIVGEHPAVFILPSIAQPGLLGVLPTLVFKQQGNAERDNRRGLLEDALLGVSS